MLHSIHRNVFGDDTSDWFTCSFPQIIILSLSLNYWNDKIANIMEKTKKAYLQHMNTLAGRNLTKFERRKAIFPQEKWWNIKAGKSR